MKKTGDFGPIFGRHKKEKMILKENEDEKSLVSLSKPSNARPLRKNHRKKKINTKFRRLREEWEEAGTPEYEPPKGFDWPGEIESKAVNDDTVGINVPQAIEVSDSKCDTISTLEGSLVEILHKENIKKKQRADRLQSQKKKPKGQNEDSNRWAFNFQEKAFCVAPAKVQPNQEKEKKDVKKEKKLVEPRFYPLEETLSSGEGSNFEIPTFGDFACPKEANIQFTCSEEYENDENVEKVSSVGSDDFHQFVVKKIPSLPAKISQARTKDENTLRKAAETIAISLSSSTPHKSRNRMVPIDGSIKRSRKALAETESRRNVATARDGHMPISSESRLLRSGSKKSHNRSRSNHETLNSQNTTESGSLHKSTYSTDDSVLMGQASSSDDSLLKDISDPSTKLNSKEMEQEEKFCFGSFSSTSEPIWASQTDTPKIEHDGRKPSHFFGSRDELIERIRSSSSRRSEDGSSKKPDPSPKETRHADSDKKSFAISERNTSKLRDQQPGRDRLNDRDVQKIFPSYSSSSGQGALSSNPSGIPSNAILGSMLFRHAHSESTMALPGEKGRPGDLFDGEDHDVPSNLSFDAMEQQTVSSVTEDAGSFYHDNVERWNNRAHRALNNLYSSYHSASAHLDPYIRGARGAAGEFGKVFDP